MAHKQHIYFSDATHKMLLELAKKDNRSVSGWVNHVVQTIHAKQFSSKTLHNQHTTTSDTLTQPDTQPEHRQPLVNPSMDELLKDAESW